MGGSSFGSLFCITSWGESHGKGVGVVIDGCPAGLPLCGDDVQRFLDRRKPGQSKYSTPRREGDEAEILSGVFEGMTTGAPLAMFVRNTSQHSSDYDELREIYRPGHADYTFDAKYGFRDHRGGGRSSGRETIARVAAGAVAVKILNRLGITLTTYTLSIGEVCAESFDPAAIMENPLYMPDRAAAERAQAYLDACMRDGDSSGGMVECVIHGMPAGVGEPAFRKLDACLGEALLSVGAVKAVEIGDGLEVSRKKGSENNDGFAWEDGEIRKLSNHSGGILGGISDGGDIVLRAAVKPTPSISAPQSTANRLGENVTVRIKGRHDPVIVPRAVVVVESMAAVTLVDQLFLGMSCRMKQVEQFYAAKRQEGKK